MGEQIQVIFDSTSVVPSTPFPRIPLAEAKRISPSEATRSSSR